MDHFGIGAAVRGAAEVYFRSARQSGRTTSLVESLRDGDRVIFVNPRQADIVRRMCLERGLKIDCVVVEPKAPERIFSALPSNGRTLLDHTWVETYYRDALRRLEQDIDRLQRESSGYGTAHAETNWCATEIRKWTW